MRDQQVIIMEEKIDYGTGTLDKKGISKEYFGNITNSDVVMEILSLVLVLYARIEHPTKANSIPVMNRIPKILESMSDGKKLSILNLAFSPYDSNKEINKQLKEIYFCYFDKYRFTHEEKELAWLLLRAYSTDECAEQMNLSVPSFRYSIKKMCGKTNTKSRSELVSKLRNDIDGQ